MSDSNGLHSYRVDADCECLLNCGGYCPFKKKKVAAKA